MVVHLGLDLRLPLGKLPGWSSDRREAFLIRPEVQGPASVDRDVWPQAIVAPSDHPLGLWGSLRDIESHRGSIVTNDSLAIKIDVLTDETWAKYFRGVVERGDPRNVSSEASNFELLGFDIADLHFLSALSNCMYPPHLLAELRALWSERINSVGLILDLDTAVTLRNTYDHLVPEHSPFFVYQLSVAGHANQST